MAFRTRGCPWCLLILVVLVTVLWVPSWLNPPIERTQMPYLWQPKLMNLSIRKNGRLGNQNLMFQFASLVGIGLSSEIPVVLSRNFLDFREIFELAQCQYPTISAEEEESYQGLHVPLSLGYDRRFQDIRPHLHSPRTAIVGYMQSFRYFENCEHLIRSCFQFKPEITQIIWKFINTNVPRNRVSVGIHIRRGDYGIAKHQTRGMTIAGASYFHKAMDLMLNKYPNAFFIVASDDMAWAKTTLGSRAVMTPFRSAQHDLALLASCQHTIISSGTFSWWAGWLSNGTTIYYQDYPRKGSSLFAGFNHYDYYCKDWIPLRD